MCIRDRFTPVPSEKVRPFRVKESPVQIECKVRQVIETGDGPGSANLIICEALLIHVNNDVLDKSGAIDSRKLDLVGRMGADYYVRAAGRALFTLEKPASKQAIGVDSLPEDVRMSSILTGNDLGRLGSIQIMPTYPEIEKYLLSPVFRTISTKYSDSTEKISEEAHKLAHGLISANELQEALLLLLAASIRASNDQ
jgi:hypothetical protein